MLYTIQIVYVLRIYMYHKYLVQPFFAAPHLVVCLPTSIEFIHCSLELFIKYDRIQYNDTIAIVEKVREREEHYH